MKVACVEVTSADSFERRLSSEAFFLTAVTKSPWLSEEERKSSKFSEERRELAWANRKSRKSSVHCERCTSYSDGSKAEWTTDYKDLRTLLQDFNTKITDGTRSDIHV